MEEYLACFFCMGDKEKQTIILDTILCGSLPFAKKIDVVVSIFENVEEVPPVNPDNPDYTFSRVREYLTKIRNTRNAVAHRSLQMDGFMNEPIESRFVFKDNFGNKSPKEITNENLHDFVMEVCYCLDFFQQEIDKIKTPS